MDSPKIDLLTYSLIIFLTISLIVAGYLSYKSIDWTVLQRIESQTLVLPSPAVASPSAQIASPSVTK